MKYIITESAVRKAIFKYLDLEEYFILDLEKEYNNYIYFLSFPDSKSAKICVYTHNAFGELKNWIYISSELINEMQTIFSMMSRHEIRFMIGEWVEKELEITSNKIEDTRYEGINRLSVEYPRE